jgi:hypothetical protein
MPHWSAQYGQWVAVVSISSAFRFYLDNAHVYNYGTSQAAWRGEADSQPFTCKMWLDNRKGYMNITFGADRKITYGLVVSGKAEVDEVVRQVASTEVDYLRRFSFGNGINQRVIQGSSIEHAAASKWENTLKKFG